MDSEEVQSEVGNMKRDTVDNSTENRKERDLPQKCSSCLKDLYVGISFYVFSCHLHAVCSSCFIPEEAYQMTCALCSHNQDMEGAKRDHSRPAPEDKNSLSILPITASNGVVLAPRSHLHDYPPLHPTPSVGNIKHDRSINISDNYYTCWSVGDDDDIIIVGGRNELNQPTLAVVSSTGQVVKHVLSRGQEIMSGLFVKTWLHIICVCYGDWKETRINMIHLVTLDPTSSNASIIPPLINLNITNPVYVFQKSRQLFGILCMDGSSKPYSYGRIRLLGLDQIILSQETDVRTLQSTSLWGRRTLIHLDLPEASVNDKVAMTPRGYYCILSCFRSEIRVYSGTGVYMYTIGMHKPGKVSPGGLLYPASIQCTRDNDLVVTGQGGELQIYNLDSSGSLSRLKYPWVDDDDNGEYTTDGKRKVYYLKQDPAGWRIEKKRGKYTHTHIMTYARIWIIRKDSVVDVYKIQ